MHIYNCRHTMCPQRNFGYTIHVHMGMHVSCSVMSDSLQPHGLQPTRLLCPWGSPGKKTRVHSHSLLQEIVLTQGSKLHLLCLLHCRQILNHWATGEALYAEWSEVKVPQSCPALCDPMDCPWNSPGQNTGVGSLSLLQGIFLIQELNPNLLCLCN